MPSVHQDLGTYWTLLRLQVLMVYGEGPHIAALTFLPLAVLALDWALGKRTPAGYLVAALSMDAVALTNWLGSFALALGVVAYLVATSWNEGAGSWSRRWFTTAGIAVLAYALASPWIPPSTIRDIDYNAQYVGGSYALTFAKSVFYLALAALVVIVLKIVFRRSGTNPPLQFFLLFAVLTGGIALAGQWFEIAVVPQPQRYHLEMELAICLAAVFLLKPLFDRLSRHLRTFAALAAVVFCIPLVRWDRQYAKLYIKPLDINTTVEFQTAKWLDSQFTNARVVMPGSISYWLNAFNDTPQFGGGFDQGIVNRVQPAVAYQVGAAPGAPEETAKISMIWFKAYGIAALGLQGPNSREIYKPFLASSRFRGLLPEAMRDGDDAIALVPGISSLAHVIPAAAMVRSTPINGNDVTEASRYVDALGAPPANLRWTSRHSVEIEANLRSGDVISFQETYHPGWHATLNGLPRRISRDGLGQMIVNTDFVGDAKIELAYDGGLEMKLARILSWSSLAGCVIWLLISKRQNSAR